MYSIRASGSQLRTSPSAKPAATVTGCIHREASHLPCAAFDYTFAFKHETLEQWEPSTTQGHYQTTVRPHSRVIRRTFHWQPLDFQSGRVHGSCYRKSRHHRDGRYTTQDAQALSSHHAETPPARAPQSQFDCVCRRPPREHCC